MGKSRKATPASKPRHGMVEHVKSYVDMIQLFDLETAAIYGIVESFCIHSEDKTFKKSVAWIARRIRKGHTLVSDRLGQLADAGYIVPEERAGLESFYTLPTVQTFEDLTSPSSGEVSESQEATSPSSGEVLTARQPGPHLPAVRSTHTRKNLKKVKEKERKLRAPANIKLAEDQVHCAKCGGTIHTDNVGQDCKMHAVPGRIFQKGKK